MGKTVGTPGVCVPPLTINNAILTEQDHLEIICSCKACSCNILKYIAWVDGYTSIKKVNFVGEHRPLCDDIQFAYANDFHVYMEVSEKIQFNSLVLIVWFAHIACTLVNNAFYSRYASRLHFDTVMLLARVKMKSD